RWFGIDLVRAQRILQKKARVLDQSELGVLIFGNETLQRQHPADLRQLAQLFGGGRGPGKVAFEHIDRVRARVGTFHQVEQCHDRFSLLYSKDGRVEVDGRTLNRQK